MARAVLTLRDQKSRPFFSGISKGLRWVGVLILLLGAAVPYVVWSSEQREKKANLIEMPDAIETGTGFSFWSKGIIPANDRKTGTYSLDLDFYWDPEGRALIFNNADHGFGFTGKARIVDLGKIELSAAKDFPDKKGALILGHGMTKIGHTYCVRLANGKGIGFFRVLEYDPVKTRLLFEWRLQAEK